MSLGKLFLLAACWPCQALLQTGEEVHCVGDRAHVLRYNVEGEPNDGSSMKGIKSAVVSMEPSPEHAGKCAAVKSDPYTPTGDKTFCYGVNQDTTCTSAKADLPLEGGKFTCKDCFIGATADVYYALNYTWNHLNSVEVGLKDMHLRGSVAIGAHVSEAATPVKGTTVLKDDSQMVLIDKLVGCPVCVKAKISVAAPTSLDYEVSLKASADITAGAEVDVNLGDRAIKWDDVAGWTYPEHALTASAKPILEIGNVQAEADVTLSLDTSLQIDVDSIVWYHLNLKPSFPLKCSAEGAIWPVHKAQFCLKGDADLTIGHEADLHWNLLAFKENHHWGPHQDKSWSKSGAVNFCKDVGNSDIVV